MPSAEIFRHALDALSADLPAVLVAVVDAAG